MCLLQCPIIFFLEKQNFLITSFNLKEAIAVIFHARYENDLKTKQTESEGI